MKWIRRVHSWLGVLFAPSILMFALSGILQLSGCHEGEAGDEPASWVVRLSQLHMKQTVELPRRRAAKPAPTAPTMAAAVPTAPRTQPNTTPLKIFFTLMAFGLMASTLLGLYMAFTPKRDRRLLAALLALGTIGPILLMLV
jgi:hypothetical protein